MIALLTACLFFEIFVQVEAIDNIQLIIIDYIDYVDCLSMIDSHRLGTPGVEVSGKSKLTISLTWTLRTNGQYQEIQRKFKRNLDLIITHRCRRTNILTSCSS